MSSRRLRIPPRDERELSPTFSRIQGGPRLASLSLFSIGRGRHPIGCWLRTWLEVSWTDGPPSEIARIRLYTGPYTLRKVVAVDFKNHRNHLSIRTDFSRFRQIIKTVFKEPFRKRIVYAPNLPESDCRSFS